MAFLSRPLRSSLMKLPAFAFLAFALLIQAAEACSSDCGGCNRVKLKGTSWETYIDTVKAQTGISPISCYRSYKCQVQLWNSCGKGIAARPGRSNHEHGIALDYSTKGGQDTAALRYIHIVQGPVGRLYHYTRGGGKRGLHLSNSSGEGTQIGGRGKSGSRGQQAKRQDSGKSGGGYGHKAYKPRSPRVARYKKRPSYKKSSRKTFDPFNQLNRYSTF